MIKYQNRQNCEFYDEENFLNNTLLPLYKNSYLQTPRAKHKNPELFNFKINGNYVGDVIDEYDKPINKNGDQSFNYQNKYDDLEKLLDDYKKQIGL